MKKNFPLIIQILIAATCLIGTSQAGTHTWSGAGANTLWSNPANWSSGGVPTSVEAAPVKLIFPSNAVSHTSTLNISNLKIDSIVISLDNLIYTFPNAGISATFTGAAGDNILLTGNSGSVVWQPPINLQSTCRFNTPLFAQTLDIQGTVAGNGGITKTGAGFLRFSTGSAANTFTGVMRVEAGTLDLSKVAGTPCFGGNLEVSSSQVRVFRSHQIPDTASISLSSSSFTIDAVIGAGSSYETIGPLSITGVSSIAAFSPNTIALGGNVTCDNNPSTNLTLTAFAGGQFSFAGATRTFAVPNASSYIEILGTIVDGVFSAGINKTGAGKLKLKNANSLSGPFSITGGTLEIFNAGALGSTSGSTSISAGATLLLGANFALPAAETINLAGAIKVGLGIGSEIQGNIVLSGSPSMAAEGGNILKLSGVVSGNPSDLIIGGGSIEFAGSSSNTYTGVTRFLADTNAMILLNKSVGTAIGGTINVSNGTLKSLKSHQINDASSVWFETGGILNLNSQTETLNSVYSSPGAINPMLAFGDGSLTVIGNGNYQFGFNALDQMVNITGSSLAAFRKQGTGTMTLVASGSPQNTHLYVQSGILNIQGAWLSTIHAVGGLLKGTATTGNVIAEGGDIAFDKFNSSGFSNNGLGGNLIFALNGAIPGTGFARVTVTGALNLTGIQLKGSLDFLPRTDASFTLIDNNGPGPVTGTFAGLPEGSILTIGGQSFRITYNGGPEGKDVVLHFIGKGHGLPEIISVTKLSNSSIEFIIKGSPGETVNLQYNTDGLTGNWTNTKIMVLDASGNGSHIRWNSDMPREFYRLSYTK